MLKELFYGNLIPANRQIVLGSEIAHVTDKLSQIEDQLSEALTPDILPTLNRLIDTQTTLNGLTGEVFYIDGFKAGARFMMEILDNAYENMKPISG